MTTLALRAAAAIALSLLIVGCGTAGPDSTTRTAAQAGTAAQPAEQGAPTPQDAVSKFVRLTGSAEGDRQASLADACGLLSPDIRAAMQFGSSVTWTDKQCAGALATALYYTGENSDVSPPDSFTATIDDTTIVDDQAVVSLTVDYAGVEERDPSTGAEAAASAYQTKVLAVRRDGQWWVASPRTLNVLYANEQITDDQLAELYRQLTAAASEAQQRFDAGAAATTEIDDDLEDCPQDGRSSADDPSGDIKLNVGMQLADEQPGSADLIAAAHSSDSDTLCFEMRFAGEAPDEGTAELTVLPSGGRVGVLWTPDGVVGQSDDNDEPNPIKVSASRDGSDMTVRVPSSAFANPTPPYRWAVQVFTPASQHRSYVDDVPGGETANGEDQYILHG